MIIQNQAFNEILMHASASLRMPEKFLDEMVADAFTSMPTTCLCGFSKTTSHSGEVSRRQTQYSLWVKTGGGDNDLQIAVDQLQDLEDVIGADSMPLPGSSAMSSEAILAITLGVTAKFATDGLKIVFRPLTEDEGTEIIMCRRPDGKEHDLNIISTDIAISTTNDNKK